MTKFYTSDTHFGHKRVLDLGQRPYSTVDEMDAALIANWNAVVGGNDVVYHLGDFSLSNVGFCDDILSSLNGEIHLIWGNHDREGVRKHRRWASSQYAKEIKDEGMHITLCHYAMRTWNGSHHGALMLHGHSHGQLAPNSMSLDVGVDAGWGYKPITLGQIKERLSSLPKPSDVDYHFAIEDFEV